MKLAAKKIVGSSGQRRFNTARLSDMEVRERVTVTLKNKFAALAEVDEDEDVDIMWQHRKRIFADACREVLEYRKTTRREWISDDPWKGIEATRKLKQKLNRETCMVKKRTYIWSTRVKGEK